MSWRLMMSCPIMANNNDRTVQPELQRFIAERISAAAPEIDSRHVPILSQPDLAPDVKAPTSVQRLREHKVYRTCSREPEESPGEAPLQTAAEFVRDYSAIVNALTATVLNADAGLNWLSVEPPDLEEARRSLNTIASDAKRVGEIVVRIRARMETSPTADNAPDP